VSFGIVHLVRLANLFQMQEKKNARFSTRRCGIERGAVPKRVCLQEYGVPFWEQMKKQLINRDQERVSIRGDRVVISPE
jgi:hypothetical protein